MKTIDKINKKISFLKDLSFTTSIQKEIIYVVLNPDTERTVFTNNEIAKSEDLENYLSCNHGTEVRILLDKKLKPNEVIIGV